MLEQRIRKRYHNVKNNPMSHPSLDFLVKIYDTKVNLYFLGSIKNIDFNVSQINEKEYIKALILTNPLFILFLNKEF